MLNELSIARLRNILKELNDKAVIADQNNALHKAHKMIENNPIFSRQLFSTDSEQFQDYINEINRNVSSLSRLIHAKQKELSSASLEKVEHQIQAIVTALSANQTMLEDAQIHLDMKISSIKARQLKQSVQNVIQSSQALYQKLSEHHEFERRLIEMLNEQERLLANCQSNQRQKFSQQVLVIHQRLGRCRKAISIIERDIEFSEKR